MLKRGLVVGRIGAVAGLGCLGPATGSVRIVNSWCVLLVFGGSKHEVGGLLGCFQVQKWQSVTSHHVCVITRGIVSFKIQVSLLVHEA
jgi:hypothetical protein